MFVSRPATFSVSFITSPIFHFACRLVWIWKREVCLYGSLGRKRHGIRIRSSPQSPRLCAGMHVTITKRSLSPSTGHWLYGRSLQLKQPNRSSERVPPGRAQCYNHDVPLFLSVLLRVLVVHPRPPPSGGATTRSFASDRHSISLVPTNSVQ